MIQQTISGMSWGDSFKRDGSAKHIHMPGYVGCSNCASGSGAGHHHGPWPRGERSRQDGNSEFQRTHSRRALRKSQVGPQDPLRNAKWCSIFCLATPSERPGDVSVDPRSSAGHLKLPVALAGLCRHVAMAVSASVLTQGCKRTEGARLLRCAASLGCFGEPWSAAS